MGIENEFFDIDIIEKFNFVLLIFKLYLNILDNKLQLQKKVEHRKYICYNFL